MTKVIAALTTSVDGYIAGPDDGPGKGLGEGGERLHYWVFGGPWTYDAEPRGEATGEDAAYLERAMARRRRRGRRAQHLRGRPALGRPQPVRACRCSSSPTGPRRSPTIGEFTFVDGVEEALAPGARGRRRAGT